MCKFLQEEQLKKLHNAFIKPYTEYHILAWGGALKAHLNKVSRSLKKAVRVMMFKNNYVSTKPLFEYLNIAPFDQYQATAKKVHETIIT